MQSIRKSNIELLRIILFLCICFFHVTSTGLNNSNSYEMFSFSWYYAVIIRVLVAPAVMTFVVIGGYVLKENEPLDISKKLKKTFFPILMYIPFLLYLTYIVFGKEQFFLTNLKNFLTFNGAFYHLWYIVVYFVITLLFSIFKNGINKNQDKRIIVILLSIIFLIGVNSFSSFSNFLFFNGIFTNTLFAFFALYAFGYCLKIYDVKINKILNIFLIIILYVMYILFALSTVNEKGINFNFLDNTNIFSMLIAILNVILFSSLNIKNNVINKLSKLTYGAYIIHIYFIFKCNDIINLNSTYNNKYYCLFDILFVLLVFILSLLTEFLRIKIVKLIKKLIVKTKKFL